MIFPIITLNNMIEDAKDNNRSLWILLQDIRHAFNSVSPQLMKNDLCKLKRPEILIDIILNLVGNRTTTVQTFYGPTHKIKLQRSIDQGDCISPLLWILFYKPLLERIKKEIKGYLIEVKVTSNL